MPDQHTITPELLKQIVPTMPLTKRREWAPLITAACLEFQITNEARVAAFLAQCAHESDGFHTLVEYASGSAYEGRRDLGNVKPGDGKRYKGRGAIQLTGRTNYRAAGQALGMALEANPELAAQPHTAFRIAGWYWQKHGLNALADSRAFRQITKVINGGYNGLAERMAYYTRALAALPDDFKLAADAPDPDPNAVMDVTAEDLAATGAGSHSTALQRDATASAGLPSQPAASGAQETASQAVSVAGGGALDAPTPVQAQAPERTGSLKSLITYAGTTLTGLGVTLASAWGAISTAVANNPKLMGLAIVGLLVAIAAYWKYQDRQTRMDLAREAQAHEINKLQLQLAAGGDHHSGL
jgi:predicted chitinase